MLTLPARQFSRGDVEEQKDAYGDFIVVKSVVEYDLAVAGEEQLALEFQVAGDAALQTWVNGQLHDEAALAPAQTGVGQHDEPEWVAVAAPIRVAAGAERLKLVLRSASVGLDVAPRRVYQLRVTATAGSGAAALASAERQPWDYLSWLLERYPLGDEPEESPFLRPREPFRFDPTLPAHSAHPTAYPDAISSDRAGYLVGNALLRHGEVEPNQLTPSLGSFVFGPTPTPEAEKQMEGHWGCLTGRLGEIELRAADGKPIELRGNGLHFQPHELEMRFEGPGVRVEVDTAIDWGGMLEARIRLTSDEPASLVLSGALNLPGKWWQDSGLWLGQTVFHYMLGLDLTSSVEAKVTEEAKPLGYRIELEPSTEAELVVRLQPGYRVKDIREALLAQRKSNLTVAERSRQEFRDFYSRVVPPFACSDQRLVDIYYYVAYTVRASMVDVPFEPYMDPYLTCSKVAFGGLNMWPENVASDALYLRWLNDKRLGERAIRKGVERPDTGPLQPSAPQPGSGAFNIDRSAVTIREFAKCSDDPEFLDLVRRGVRANADRMVEHPLEDGALEAYDHMLPQYDFSLRYKPFTQGRVWWGSRMDQPLAHIDANTWRYQILRLAAAYARAEGDASAAQLEARAEAVREAINRLMWDDEAGFYFDYATGDRARSDVMSVAAFSTLWAGVADRARADRLVEHLTNPKEFWPRFPVPATSLADPRTNPRGYTDGGILLDVNNWFPLQGLLKMGYRDVAAELFWRTMDLMSAQGILSWGCYNFTADDGSPFPDRMTADSGVGVDMMLRCTTGFIPRTDDLFEFDPVVLGPRLASLDWGPYRYKKHWLETHWRAAPAGPKARPGLTIVVDKARYHLLEPKHVLLRLDQGELESVPIVPDPLDP